MCVCRSADCRDRGDGADVCWEDRAGCGVHVSVRGLDGLLLVTSGPTGDVGHFTGREHTPGGGGEGRGESIHANLTCN